MAILLITVASGLVWLGIGLVLLFSVLRGAPYVPSVRGAIEEMLALAGVKEGMRVADLGSGDGRVVMAFARAGAEAHGYEVNPVLAWWSRRRIKKAGLAGQAVIHCRSFWQENFSSFDVIVLYAIPHIMRGLEKKLRRELKPGALVLSNAFTFPNWPPRERRKFVHLYEQTA